MQLTYGDRMGTADHDMEGIRRAFSQQKSARCCFQVLDEFISLETSGTNAVSADACWQCESGHNL